MRANSGLMSTIVGSLPGNIALKYILSNLDEKHNTHIYVPYIYYTLFRCTEGSTKLWLILSYSELTNMGAFVGWFAWPLRVQVKWKYIDLEWYWSLADYSTIIDPFVLVILYIPYNCCCIYVHPSFPVVKIHSWVDMVGTIHNDLLTQWRHIPIGRFCFNIFF